LGKDEDAEMSFREALKRDSKMAARTRVGKDLSEATEAGTGPEMIDTACLHLAPDITAALFAGPNIDTAWTNE